MSSVHKTKNFLFTSFRSAFKRLFCHGSISVLLSIGIVCCHPNNSGEHSTESYITNTKLNIVPIAAGNSWAYLVFKTSTAPTPAVLVDCGSDPEATAILKALAQHGLSTADLRAVLITHGHLDHYAGIARFPDVPIYTGAYTARVLRGDKWPHAPMAKFVARMRSRPKVKAPIHTLLSGTRFEIDGLSTFVALLVPGHARDSMVFYTDQVLFVGDVFLVGDTAPYLPARWWSADNSLVKPGLKRLMMFSEELTSSGEQWQRVADGHTGLHEFSEDALRSFVVRGDAL